MQVVAINVAPGSRLPTRSLDAVVVEAGTGLVGDRYHGARHRRVLLEVVRVSAPCRLLDDWIGPGAARALHRRAGSTFRLLTSSTLCVGDTVEVFDGAA